MTAAVLTGFGGLDKLEIRDDILVPNIGPGEVLIEVGACGLNNTDINTRAGWYNPLVRVGTTKDGGTNGFRAENGEPFDEMNTNLKFPRIQGADVAGWIAKVGDGIPQRRVGERVLIDPRIRDLSDPDNLDRTTYLGNGVDGGFAQFCKVPSINALSVTSTMSTEELATFPCSSSTAELMLTRARVTQSETILITGASGGVGSALIQLAKRRGAFVIALTSSEKIEGIRKLGADAVVSRDLSDVASAIKELSPKGRVDVVADIAGGEDFSAWIQCLRRAGTYVTSGAIAGPIVELDLRELYLKDLNLLGATAIPREIFTDLVRYIEDGEIKPLLAMTFSLEQIVEAQETFMNNAYIGNLVVIPTEVNTKNTPRFSRRNLSQKFLL